MSDVEILIQRLDDGLPLPERAHPGDAGFDLRSTVDLVLAPGERALVPTGIAVAIPLGYAGLVQPRSGLAARHGVSIVNTPGLIDSGYRGEIKVIAINLDPKEPFEIHRGDKIAQIVFYPVPETKLREVDELPDSERGEGGFGSSGR
ncbi:MAG: dUTP diphosphatase [Actinomycetota bacterium]